MPIVLGTLFPLAFFIILGIFLLCRFRKIKNKLAAIPESSAESGDDLANNLRTHLAGSRQSYLEERGASIQRNSTGSHSPEIIFHPSDLSSDHSRPYAAETSITARSGSSSLSDPPFTIKPLAIRRISNEGLAPKATTFRRPIRDDLYPHSGTSTPTPIPSSPTLSHHVQIWRQPQLPTQYSTEKYPSTEQPHRSEGADRSGPTSISRDGRTSYELPALNTPFPGAGGQLMGFNRQSQPHELE